MIIKDFIFVNVDFWSSELQTTLKIHTYIYIYIHINIYIYIKWHDFSANLTQKCNDFPLTS